MTHNAEIDRRPDGRGTTYAFRVVGALLLILILVPFYRTVANTGSDRIATDVVDAADLSRTLFLLGSLITLTLGVIASRVVDPARFEQNLERIARWLVSIPVSWFAGSLAILSA